MRAPRLGEIGLRTVDYVIVLGGAGSQTNRQKPQSLRFVSVVYERALGELANEGYRVRFCHSGGWRRLADRG